LPIEQDSHLLTVCRYVERNALRAKLVRRAEDWQSCSLWRRRNGKRADRAILLPLADWPVTPPRTWREQVNRPETPEELEALRRSVIRGTPYGGAAWQKRTAARLGLESSLRPRGRLKRETA
jgi:putative transposase